MPRYYHEKTFHRQIRFIKRIRRIAFIAVGIVLLVIAVIIFDAWNSSRQASRPSVPTTPSNSTFSSSFEVHRTQYFQFQAPKGWLEIANETTDNRYVYRGYNGPLVEQELVIEVNRSSQEVLALVQTTRVFPVKVIQNGRLAPQDSNLEHCQKAVKSGAGRNPQVVTQQQVTFACNPDSTIYSVVVGVVGGNDQITLVRPDGSKALYRITYKNLTAFPTARDLNRILETFEAR